MKGRKQMRLLKVIGVAIIGFMMALGCMGGLAGAKEGKKVYEFNYPSWETPGSWLNGNFYFWWARRVQELSKGEVIFHEFPAATMIPGFEHYEAVRDKVVPFAPSTGAYEIDSLPLTTILDLPNLFKDDEYDTMYRPICNELLDAGLRDYFKKHGVIPLAICPLDRYSFWTTKKRGPVKTIADTKGLKVRSPGGVMSKSLFAMGAVPVTVATGDIYTSLERGLLDGVSLTATSVSSLGILPVLGYWSPQAGTSRANLWILANLETFNTLPKHLQDIMVQAGQELEEQWWKKLTEYIGGTVHTEAGKHKVEILDLDPAQVKEFSQAEFKVWKEWEDKYGEKENGLGSRLMGILKKHRGE